MSKVKKAEQTTTSVLFFNFDGLQSGESNAKKGDILVYSNGERTRNVCR